MYVVLVALALAGCSTLPGTAGPQSLDGAEGRVELTGVPFYPDTEYYCGPAALATTLGWSGLDVTPEALAGRLYLPDRKGTLQTELIAQARQARRLAYVIDGDLAAVRREVGAGQPVIVLQNLALSWWPRWHYAIAVGFDADTDVITLRSGPRARHRLDATIFDRTWKRGGRWALVTPAPGVLPATAVPGRVLVAAAELEQTTDADAALPYWRRAAERWPEDGRLHTALANALLATGENDAALAALNRGRAEARDHRGVVLNNLALLLAERERLDDAIAAAAEAVTAGGRHVETFRDTWRTLRCRSGNCPNPTDDPAAK